MREICGQSFPGDIDKIRVIRGAKGSEMHILGGLLEQEGHLQRLCTCLDLADPEFKRYKFKAGDCPIV